MARSDLTDKQVALMHQLDEKHHEAIHGESKEMMCFLALETWKGEPLQLSDYPPTNEQLEPDVWGPFKRKIFETRTSPPPSSLYGEVGVCKCTRVLLVHFRGARAVQRKECTIFKWWGGGKIEMYRSQVFAQARPTHPTPQNPPASVHFCAFRGEIIFVHCRAPPTNPSPPTPLSNMMTAAEMYKVMLDPRKYLS